MVLFVLYAKADLEGITSLSLVPDANICISVRNSLTHDQKRERIVIDPTELHQAEIPDHEKHRAEHASHFGLTWEGEQTRSTIRILSNTKKEGEDNSSGKHKKNEKRSKNNNGDDIVVKNITPHDDGQFVPILKLECDGLEPYAFHPMGEEFAIINNGGSKVMNVDLSSGEWSDYHLESGTSLVQNFESKFE
mmetsp:Transcript_17195/g.23636  ORF Transcript_17195/g.23636 Transcript_17195/m.23636 type:complete len:192 (-) Transcript_17195:325-900(-)